jgi:hypothetical protein
MLATALENTIHSERGSRSRSNASGEFTMPNGYKLWIDGVGTYLVLLDDRVTIGGERWEGDLADLRLQSGIRRIHAAIERDGEDYWLVPQGDTKLDGREIRQRTPLRDGVEIGLIPCVRLGWTLPSPLSSSARIDFLTAHRPAERVDGIVLMSETCLLGPGANNHVTCPPWEANLVLYRRGEELHGRCRKEWSIDGVPVEGASRIQSGNIVRGPEFCFRLERIGQ